MKKFFNVLKTDLSKAFNSGFIICIIVTACLCFTTVIYINADTGKEYSVIELAISKKNAITQGYTFLRVIDAAISTYLTMFITILSSLPFISSFCAERNSKNIRLAITRAGKYNYYFSKFISAGLSAATAVLCGFILYSIAVAFMFPTQFNTETFTYTAKLFVGIFLYGFISAQPAFFLSSFVKNKYIICCIPFIALNFYYSMLTKIVSYFIINELNDKWTKMYFLYPDAFTRIFTNEANDFNVAIYFAALTVVGLLGYIIIMNRRLDYGE